MHVEKQSAKFGQVPLLGILSCHILGGFQIQIYLFFPSQTINFKIIQRNINTEKLNNTIRHEDAIKNAGPKN